MRLKPNRLIAIIGGMAFATLSAFAQEPAAKPAVQPPVNPEIAVNATQKGPDTGRFTDVGRQADSEETGPYEIKESAEVGGRITSYTGNVGTWDTFVNLGSGWRLLE